MKIFLYVVAMLGSVAHASSCNVQFTLGHPDNVMRVAAENFRGFEVTDDNVLIVTVVDNKNAVDLQIPFETQREAVTEHDRIVEYVNNCLFPEN